MISIIAAIGKNRELGVKDRIPWHIKEDLLHFKHLTLEKTVIVGRKTFESLLGYYQKSQRPFPKRNYIIVTRDTGYHPDTSTVVEPEKSRFLVAASIEEALSKALNMDKGEVFIIGGASMYGQGIKFADKLYLTLVDKEVSEADAFFPDFSAFKKTLHEETGISGDIQYKFIELVK
ncbi:MAG: dihydrofolate reductase [Patescibacteria group bacterium]